MDAVTGAFGYTGRFITRRLLEAGREVRTLTGHPSRPDPFGGKVSVVPFAFDDPAAVRGSRHRHVPRPAGVRRRRRRPRRRRRGPGDNSVTDAVGPETYTFEELVRLVARAVGRRPRLVHLPPTILIGLVKVLGLALGDVRLTVDELRGLMAGLVATEGPPTGATRLGEWLDEHAGDIGRVYASELARHYR
jgi:uncharacterized protein YbjT (DUF2867 family)